MSEQREQYILDLTVVLFSGFEVKSSIEFIAKDNKVAIQEAEKFIENETSKYREESLIRGYLYLEMPIMSFSEERDQNGKRKEKK